MAFFQFLQPLCLLFLLLSRVSTAVSNWYVRHLFNKTRDPWKNLLLFIVPEKRNDWRNIYIHLFLLSERYIFFILLFSLLLLNSNFGSICVKWPSFNNSLNWLLMKNSKSEIEIFYFTRSKSFLLFFSYTYIRKRFAYVIFFLGRIFFLLEIIRSVE